ncbi:MAG: DUF1836 domain-containing protein [Lachnospira sp.]|nr:DUF1836 domain-containing protein [Lachnospira sp.]
MPNSKNKLKELIKEWVRLDYINPEDVPSIELYMDQVTTFMDKELANTKRYETDKTLTKTMINNYTKNNLLPPPVKKKYSKEHIYLLIYIYYFKNSLTISDIQQILSPMIEHFCTEDSTMDMGDIYQRIFDAEHTYFKTILENIDATHNLSKSLFKDNTGEEQDYLNHFAFLSLLGYDIYLKKKLMEKLIDSFSDTFPKSEPKEKPAKENKKANKKTEE